MHGQSARKFCFVYTYTFVYRNIWGTNWANPALALLGQWHDLAPSPCPSNTMSKQHEALFPSIFTLWILAVHFSIGPSVFYVCCLIRWF